MIATSNTKLILSGAAILMAIVGCSVAVARYIYTYTFQLNIYYSDRTQFRLKNRIEIQFNLSVSNSEFCVGFTVVASFVLARIAVVHIFSTQSVAIILI